MTLNDTKGINNDTKGINNDTKGNVSTKCFNSCTLKILLQAESL